ncbi:MAG TPA: trehalose-phosphatase [Thermoanaerobaculia bacterium]|nr:trehalose-phosphatase [Thermoanaerobaculia bacterium]
MREILAPAQREILGQFAGSNTLLAFDFDGTLAPIVRDPRRAALRAKTRALLEETARLYPVVVISGRARSDARARLRSVPLAGIVGNHGLEPWRGSERVAGTVRRWAAALREALALFPGLEIEDKAYSIAVHYRRSRHRRKAKAAILGAIQTLGELRVIGGKQVVNVLPPGAPHKGIALESERERLGCDRMIYVGDDETDEDVFALDEPGRLLAIRVGRRRDSAAGYYVPEQGSVDELLRRLVELRRQDRRKAAQ